jgi:hypothetical protein
VVDRLQQQAFGDHRELDVALEEARDLVVGEQVGGVGHGDAEAARTLLEDHGAETARLGLGQTVGHLRLDREVLEVDVRNLELAGQRVGDLLLRDEALVHEHPPELAAALLLLVEGVRQLLLGEQPLLQ